MSAFDGTGSIALGGVLASSVVLGRSGITTQFAASQTVDFQNDTILNLAVPAAGTTGSIQLNSAGGLSSNSGLTFASNTLSTVNESVSGVLALANGSVSAPAAAFTGDAASGLLYDAAAASPSIAVLGVERKVFSRTKTLTNNASSNLLTISLGPHSSAALVVRWGLLATDGTNSQSAVGQLLMPLAEAASSISGSQAVTSSNTSTVSGTLTVIWSVSFGTNVATLAITPASLGITPSTMTLVFTVDSLGPANTLTFL